MKNLVNIQSLSTGYRLKRGKTRLLHQNLSVTLHQGELVGVLGPNGVGKSTLLKTLLGFIPALKGEISYGGTRLKDISVKEMAARVSVVLTTRIDDIYLTTEEVIHTARYPYISLVGKPSEKDLEMVKNAVLLTGIADLLHRKFYTLSDGEKQRVMIARALAQDTPLIFLDEPTAFIDSPGRVELMHLLRAISRQGKTILMTIHDVELALQFADTLWLLGKDGSFETGIPGDLINKGSINKLFDRGNVKFNSDKRRFV
ncbi:MAG: ABC transporter ATP-binding protein [Bacteroidetes bacterium]|nr:MAG: ABC transporter ATP-binding protein [Bacteroidota bacterium]